MPWDHQINNSLAFTRAIYQSARDLGRLMGADDTQRRKAVQLADMLTPSHMKAYARFMADKYDLVYVTDETPSLKDDIIKAIRLVRPDVDIDAYLQQWAFTLGNLIWLPFSLNAPAPKPRSPFYWQMITIAHEATHRQQAAHHQMAPFAWDYLTNEESRGQYEYEAYRVALELMPVLTGATIDPETLAAPLVEYGLSGPTRAFVVQQLTLAQDMILRGAVISDTSRATIVWLAENVDVG